jgi:hypothetical protein
MLGGDQDIMAAALQSALHSLIVAAGQADLFPGDTEMLELAERGQGRADMVVQRLRKVAESVDAAAPEP